MRAGVGWLVVPLLAVSPPPAAVAQERPGSGYVLGSVALLHQGGAADGASQIYITAPGGTTPGWAVAGGVFVTRRVSLEGECGWSGMMTAREPARYGLTYVEERRDRLFGAIVQFHATPGARVDIEPVAGVAAVAHDRWSTTEASRPWLPPGQDVEIGPRIRYDTLMSAAFISGVDLRVGGPHVAFVPAFRVRAVTRSDELRACYPGGFPRWTIGVGAGARFDF